MISCYIISEQSTVDLLKQHIERFALTTLLGHSSLDARDLTTIIKLKPKIVFVDTCLLAKCKATLLRIAQLCTVVYVSDCKNTALEAFDALGFDYILKSHTYERFETSINKFVNFSLRAPEPPRRQSSSITDYFFIKADMKGIKEIKIWCDQVLYIEAEQNYVKIHLSTGTCYISHHTMKEMEESLPDGQFGRVHKSFIINYAKIISIKGNDIFLTENEKPKIHVGNTYRKAFHEKKNQTLIKKRTFVEVMDYPRTASLVLIGIRLLTEFYSLINSVSLETFA